MGGPLTTARAPLLVGDEGSWCLGGRLFLVAPGAGSTAQPPAVPVRLIRRRVSDGPVRAVAGRRGDLCLLVGAHHPHPDE